MTDQMTDQVTDQMTDQVTDQDSRVAELEARLGDPLDAGNPLGFDAVLAADERGELLPAGERMLADFGLNAEFVPRALGGRFAQADRFAELMRSVFRRDCTLGIGYGVTNFIAGVPVWASGGEAQRRWLADLMLGNRRASAGYTELAHGADFTRAELRARARPDGPGLVLSGRKELINNISRADAVVLFARTDDAPGSRSHSHVLVDLTALPTGRHRQLPRYQTSGVRGCLLGGVEFDDCPVPADGVTGVVGELGGAMETVLKAFQVTRGVLPGMVVGVLDTQLRTAVRLALDRRLYGRAVADLPHTRSVLGGAFLDLLITDCVTTVVARALHVLPAQTSVYTAAAKYLVPKILQEATYDLSVLLGARSYLREGPYAIFQKNMRDIPVVTLAHASSAVCQATIIPQLPRLAQRGWLRTDPAPATLFRPAEPLGALDFDRLGLSARGEDSLSGTLLAIQEELAPGRGEAALVVATLCAQFVAELRELRDRCGDLPPRDRTVVAGRTSFTLADRYATVLAASACLGVWRHNQDHPDPFLPGTGWIVGALRRLAARLGRDTGPAPDGLDERVHAELLARYEAGRTFDLAGRPLAG